MNWSPLDYKDAAVLALEVGNELLSRLDWLTLKPNRIIDLGCGMGGLTEKLQHRYPNALIIGLDHSFEMLQFAKQSHTAFCYAQADAYQLPMVNESVDLIFANFLLPWCHDFSSLLKECRRVMTPDGVILFSSFGPDTLKEWRDKLGHLILPCFMDMHEIGDLLLQTKFADPVLDINYYTLTYNDRAKLYKELVVNGMIHNSEMLVNESMEQKKWSVTWEIVFAHAFAPEKHEQENINEIEIKIPLSVLRQK